MIFVLVGCSTEQIEDPAQDAVPEEVKETPIDLPVQEPKPEVKEVPIETPPPEPKKEINWYTSSHSRAKNYYCKTDSQWKTLSKTYLQGFNTEEELLKTFPDRKLHKPC